MKLKKIKVELADDFTLKPTRKGNEWPYRKRWRLWIGGSYVGALIKRNNGKFTYEPLLKFIEDTFRYKPMSDGRMEFIQSANPTIKLEYNTGKEALEAFKKDLIENLEHIVHRPQDDDIPF